MGKRGPKPGAPNAGAPEKILKDDFEKLCALQCTKSEICFFFDVHEDSLGRWCQKHYNMTFSQVFEIKRQSGIIQLRRTMMKEALAGNTALLIWLSKQWMGMTEKVDAMANIQGEIVFKTQWGEPIERISEDVTAMLPSPGSDQANIVSE